MFFEGVIADPLVGTTLVAAVNVAATYVAVILMDHDCGRKTLLAGSAAGMLACCGVLTLALRGTLSSDAAALGAVAGFVACFELGLGPIPCVILASLCQHHPH